MKRCLVLALLVPGLQGCSFVPDAGRCMVVSPAGSYAGGAMYAKMTIRAGDAQCSIRYTMSDGGFLATTGVVSPPAHGQVRTGVGPNFAAVYAPARGYVGDDSFKLALAGFGSAIVDVEVVQPPPAAPQPASAPPAAVPPATPLPATSPQPAAAFSPIDKPIGFRCPASGTVQTFAGDGGWINWLGYGPGAGDSCIGRNRNGVAVTRVRGIWNLGTIWPDSVPEVRRAMEQLTTQPPGTEVTFKVTGLTNNRDDPRPGTWTHVVRVVGGDTIAIGGRPLTTVVIEDLETTGQSSWRHRIWVDRASGLAVRYRTLEASNGKSPAWDTTELRPPS